MLCGNSPRAREKNEQQVYGKFARRASLILRPAGPAQVNAGPLPERIPMQENRMQEQRRAVARYFAWAESAAMACAAMV